jgi:hypothetical protein
MIQVPEVCYSNKRTSFHYINVKIIRVKKFFEILPKKSQVFSFLCIKKIQSNLNLKRSAGANSTKIFWSKWTKNNLKKVKKKLETSVSRSRIFSCVL